MQPSSLRIKDVLEKTTQFFREKGIESARLDTELLISSALKWERLKLYLNYDYPLSEEELAACRELVRRRASGEPVAYILGKKDFYKHSFIVNPAVLIPRPETELLVEGTIRWLNENCVESPARFVDFGTGSGCIGLSIAAEVEGSQWLGVDKSPQAIEVAQTNAMELGLTDRSHFLVSDVAELEAEKVTEILGDVPDAVVANPPYIAVNDPEVDPSVRRFEPDEALFSGADGLEHIRIWEVKAAELVRPGGLVIFEIGYKQGPIAHEIFSSSGRFEDIQILKDYSGFDRFVRAVRKSGKADHHG